MTSNSSRGPGEAMVTASRHGGGGTWRVPAFMLDAGIGSLMLAIGLWFWFGAAWIQSRSRGLMSPIEFPRAISAMLVLCAVLLIARSLIPGRLFSARLAKASALILVERPWFVLAAMGMSVLYPLLMANVGYYLATALWLPPFFWIAGYRRPVGIALATAGFLVFTSVIFQHVLGTPMP